MPSISLRSPSAQTSPPRPTSPSTRFAPTLCHSATWASPHLRTGPSCRLRLAGAALPLTGPRITIVARDFVHVHHADRRRAPQLVDHDDDRAAVPPQRRFTSIQPGAGSARRLRRHRPARALRLAALVVGTAAPRSASPGAGSPVTGFRTTPCTCVSATAIASVSVLDTTAFTTSRTLRHSVAVAAPLRRGPPAPIPLRLCPWFLRSPPPARALVLTPDASRCRLLKRCCKRAIDCAPP